MDKCWKIENNCRKCFWLIEEFMSVSVRHNLPNLEDKINQFIKWKLPLMKQLFKMCFIIVQVTWFHTNRHSRQWAGSWNILQSICLICLSTIWLFRFYSSVMHKNRHKMDYIAWVISPGWYPTIASSCLI